MAQALRNMPHVSYSTDQGAELLAARQTNTVSGRLRAFRCGRGPAMAFRYAQSSHVVRAGPTPKANRISPASIGRAAWLGRGDADTLIAVAPFARFPATDGALNAARWARDGFSGL